MSKKFYIKQFRLAYKNSSILNNSVLQIINEF